MPEPRDVNIGHPRIEQLDKDIIADLADASHGLEALKNFVDTVESAQAVMQTAQDAIKGAQTVMQEAQQVIQTAQETTHSELGNVQTTQEQNKQTVLDSQATHEEAVQTSLGEAEARQVAVKNKMDETLLPLTGEEIPEQLNPITLADFPQLIYLNESDHPFLFGGGGVCRKSGTWNSGEEVIVLIQTKCEDGWETIWDEKFSEDSDVEKKPIPKLYNDGMGLRISIRQKVEGDGYHLWEYNFISAEREE